MPLRPISTRRSWLAKFGRSQGSRRLPGLTAPTSKTKLRTGLRSFVLFQKPRHMAVGLMEFFYSHVKVALGLFDHCEELNSQGQVKFDTGDPVTAFSSIKRQMVDPQLDVGGVAVEQPRQFVVCHPDLRHFPAGTPMPAKLRCNGKLRVSPTAASCATLGEMIGHRGLPACEFQSFSRIRRKTGNKTLRLCWIFRLNAAAFSQPLQSIHPTRATLRDTPSLGM